MSQPKATPARVGTSDTPKRRSRRSSSGDGEHRVIALREHVVYNMTDIGNADRLVATHGDEIRFLNKSGQWLAWTGEKWERDPDAAHLTRRARSVTDDMLNLAEDPTYPGDRRSLGQWGLKTQANARMKAMIELASKSADLRIDDDELDPHRHLMGVKNGVLDLRTGELLPPDPAQLITRQAAVGYDPNAECPTWMSVLESALPDPEVRAYLQRCAGYSLTAETSEQVMFLLHGNGENSKSIVVKAIQKMMGEYAQGAAQDLLMQKNQATDLSPELARLPGFRFVATAETEKGRPLGETRVKQVTGGDTVTVRPLNRSHHEIEVVCKNWLATNHLPKVIGTDHGIWRRLQVVPFTVVVADDKKDLDLEEKLRAEYPGILAWAARGAREYYRRKDNNVRDRWGKASRLDPPPAVVTASAKYRFDSDVLQQFISEECVVRDGVQVQASSLYSEYNEWCRRNNHMPMSQTSFGLRLDEKKFVRVKKSTVWWQGIALASAAGVDPFSTDTEEPHLAEVIPLPTAQSVSACRVCGETCDPVNNGIHVNCAAPGPDSPDDGPEDDDPDEGGSPAPEPDPDPIPPSASDAPVTAPETVVEASAPVPADDLTETVVTSRRRRPWTPKSTAYVAWSTGKGETDDGSPVAVPARATVARFLDALPADTQRVILVGPMPGKTGPGLSSWVSDTLPEGWTVADSGHYLDPDALAARYVRPDGGELHIHRLASWVRDNHSRITPAHARQAFTLLRDGLGVVFGRRRQTPGQPVEVDRAELAPAVLSSPASTGRELLLRSLPAGHEYPVLSDDALALLHSTTGQGRNELFTESTAAFPADELPGLYSYDMRWSYAALCKSITGSGPTELDNGTEFLGWAPARYEVEFTVPDGWDRVGLLGVRDKGSARWPSAPGETWRTWADARELRLADRWGWKIGQDVRIVRRLRFTTDKSTPLRTWADKLTELREEWLPSQTAPQVVIGLARDMTRTVLLASLGALQGRRQKVTHSVPVDQAGQIPAGAQPHVAGDLLIWESETSAGWREMVHPEWVGQVWSEQRCRLMDTGPNAAQPNIGALHVPTSHLVALRTDAVYLSTDPGWKDTGKVGAFRSQLALNGPVPTPRDLAALMGLREQG